MSVIRYPLAKQGVYRTIQGEGALLGTPMVFIRLAGCSVGCPACDTDYRVFERADAAGIVRLAGPPGPAARWAWVTGGEPTDHDLGPLVVALKTAGWKVAVATAGHRQIPLAWVPKIDWLSVSPHDPDGWVQMTGAELKIVPGLNGYGIEAFAGLAAGERVIFGHYFVSPCGGKPETVAECVEFVTRNPRWLMTTQAHKLWNIP